MSDEKKRPELGGAADIYMRSDGAVRIEPHGPDCERTREIYDAGVRGDPVPPPRAPGQRCGTTKVAMSRPAQVASDAYRSGWDGVFGGRTKGVA